MEHVGVTKLAKALGLSRQSIYRAEESGRIEREADGRFDIERVRRDLLTHSRVQMGGVHTQMQDEALEANSPVDHPVLYVLQRAWSTSLRPMAMCLRELDTFDEDKKHFGCLAIMFLMQWQIVAGSLGVPDDQPLEFTEDMATLIREGRKGVKAGSVELENWLKKEPRIDFTANAPRKPRKKKALAEQGAL